MKAEVVIKQEELVQEKFLGSECKKALLTSATNSGIRTHFKALAISVLLNGVPHP
jgi:hypothetical protein